MVLILRFSKDSVYFKGVGGVEKKPYEVTIPLYKEIDPDKSKSFNRERCIEILLAKANPEEPYWPTLTSDKKKHHWLKCDFNKWQDEDESGDEGEILLKFRVLSSKICSNRNKVLEVWEVGAISKK